MLLGHPTCSFFGETNEGHCQERKKIPCHGRMNCAASVSLKEPGNASTRPLVGIKANGHSFLSALQLIAQWIVLLSAMWLKDKVRLVLPLSLRNLETPVDPAIVMI
jgi:hypothetical protein